MIRWN